MNAQPPSPTQKLLLRLIRAIWLFMVTLSLGTFVFGVPVRYHALVSGAGTNIAAIVGFPPEMGAVAMSHLDPPEAAALESLGIPRTFYAAYLLIFDIVVVIIGAVVGLLVFWRRNQDWVALWFSFLIVLVGTSGVSMVSPSLAGLWPGWLLVYTLYGLVGMIGNVHILFISPDGRFVPGWTKILAAVFTGILLAVGTHASLLIARSQVFLPLILLLSVMFIWFAVTIVGVISQIYRYLRISGSVQRQQSKWVAAGLAAVALGFGLNALFLFIATVNFGLPRLLVHLVRAPLVNFFMALFPICLAIAIFRYRLWDIDFIIRRTLIYSLLTGLLGLIYYLGVVVFQGLLTADRDQPHPFVIVVTTLLIAALFNPLRVWVHDLIDRRFYRRKYDAERALADFAAAVRSETDLEQLSTRLVATVQDTLQPEQIEIWLKPTNPKRQNIGQ